MEDSNVPHFPGLLIHNLKEYGVFYAAGLSGIVLALYGVWLGIAPAPPAVEIIAQDAPTRSSVPQELLYIDVAGAVLSPGVYKLPPTSRIGDALVAAGGLAQQADRGWVSANLNLAQELKDGAKVFIPARQSSTSAVSAIPSSATGYGRAEKSGLTSSLININAASQGELEQLKGIGEARAQAIISNRPYSAPDELVSKAKIPQSIYDTFKDQISVY